MQKSISFGSILLLLSMTIPNLYAGGPWPLGKGSGYFQLGFYAIPPTNRFWRAHYQTQFINRAVFDGTVSLYGSYGISKQLTLSANIPTKIVSTDVSGVTDPSTVDGLPPPDSVLAAGTLVDLGNCALELKYSFWKKKRWQLAAAFRLSAPTAIQPYNSATALRTAVPAWGFEPVLMGGYGGKKWYGSLEASMRFRTHQYDHLLRSEVEIGYKVSKKAYIGFVIGASIGVGNADDTPNSNAPFQTGLSVNNQDYVAFTIKWMQAFDKHWGMHLSLGGGLWANNVQQGPALGLAIYYKWNKQSKE